MKKKILSAIVGATMLFGGICSAAVSTSQLSLGGISYGASVDAVKKSFGQPDELKTKTNASGEKIEYKYGDALEIKFVDGKVCKFEVKGGSDLKTAAGIGIGSDVAALEKAYGKPDVVRKDKYIYRAENNLELSFKVENDVVTKIKYGTFDERGHKDRKGGKDRF